MHITCPKCDTKFVIKPEQIGKNIKKVKCSKCNHIWQHTISNNDTPPETNVTNAQAPKAFKKGVNLPVLIPARAIHYSFMVPTLMVGVVIIMIAILFQNKIVNLCSFHNNDLSLQNIQILNQDDSSGRLTVRYRIYNASEDSLKVPLVRIRLLDKNKKVLESHIDDNTKIDISPDETAQITTEIVPKSPYTKSIDVMIGNKIDFFLH